MKIGNSLTPESLLEIIDHQVFLRILYDRRAEVVDMWGSVAHFVSYQGERRRHVLVFSYRHGNTVTQDEIYKAELRERGHTWEEQRMEVKSEIYKKVIESWPAPHPGFLTPEPIVAVMRQTGDRISPHSLPLLLHYGRLLQCEIQGLRQNGHGDGPSGTWDGPTWTLIRRFEGLLSKQLAPWNALQLGKALQRF